MDHEQYSQNKTKEYVHDENINETMIENSINLENPSQEKKRKKKKKLRDENQIIVDENLSETIDENSLNLENSSQEKKRKKKKKLSDENEIIVDENLSETINPPQEKKSKKKKKLRVENENHQEIKFNDCSKDYKQIEKKMKKETNIDHIYSEELNTFQKEDKSREKNLNMEVTSSQEKTLDITLLDDSFLINKMALKRFRSNIPENISDQMEFPKSNITNLKGYRKNHKFNICSRFTNL